MVDSSEDIQILEQRIKQLETRTGVAAETSIVALVETPSGVLNAHAIAGSSSRVAGLMFGAEDYMVEMDSPRNAGELLLDTPRALVAMAARAAGVEAIDTPYVNVPDLEALRRHAERGRCMGMSGILVLSPRQIEVARSVFTPDKDEVRFARRVLRAREEVLAAGQAYAFVDGELVSPSREKKAKQVLARARAIRELEERTQAD
jgi:citrate lyase subunit beta/citryl-CoA lyase